jgi:hypothetical protein
MLLENMLSITPWVGISALIWLALAIAALYLAREPAHRAILAIFQAMGALAELAAEALKRGEQKLSARNRDVLLSHGREAKERVIEREFERVADTVQKDLAGHPALQRSLSEAITRIDEDHQRAVDVPPDPPGWVKAVETVAKLDTRGDSTAGEILGHMHRALLKAHDRMLGEYRAGCRERHRLLGRMLPQWRRIQNTLTQVDKNIESVLLRSRSIDRHLTEYQELVRGTDQALRVLSSSSLVQFFVAALVLAVAIGGAAVNFSLIARPMAEMVGGTSFIGDFRTADIAALVIILVEISMGLFLMESLRITRLFPVIGALPDKLRVRMIWVTFTLLFLLASVEAGLAYMREILMQDELATAALLRGGEALAQSDYVWITTAAQMGMGFVLPFALTFVAIPLETFVHSLRTVVGLAAIGVMRLLGFVMRLVGKLFGHVGTALVRIYDILVFLPLWVASIRGRQAAGGKRKRSDDVYAEVRS